MAESEFDRTYFTFKKHGLMFPNPSGDLGKGSSYPCLVDMKGLKNFPFDYALYFSSDHARKGGIWLYLCNGSPTDAANWKSYNQAVTDGTFGYLEDKPAKNPIFTSGASGHTETPWVNIIDGTAYMSYHDSSGRSQSTSLATSTDGVTFRRFKDDDSVILDYEDGPGNGHTGYFKWAPNRFSGVEAKYVGYSLHGGGGTAYSAMWSSQDATKWKRVQVLDFKVGQTRSDARFIRWHEMNMHSITQLDNGEYVAICPRGENAFGGQPKSELYEIFLAKDGRTLTRQPRKLLSNGTATSARDATMILEPNTVVIGDTWHLIYVGVRYDGKKRTNAIMGASGTLNKSAPKSPALKGSDCQRHFHRE